MAAAAYTLSVRDSAGFFHWGVTMKIILFHIFSRLTNVQNPARQRSKSVNGLMSRIFQGTKNSYLIGTPISSRYSEKIKALSIQILQTFYLLPYIEDVDFYEQFYQRLSK